ncbi:MAG: head GIN domain-containing protein [Flavobacteriales bacterium]|nr:MAG: head GIN domain-containing protein [Flavobacteriales bacterium]
MRTFLIAIAALIAVSATTIRYTHVKGTGEVVRRNLTVPPFHGIALRGSMDVRLTPGKTTSVTVEAQANIADLVTTEVKDGIWMIATRSDYSTQKPFVVHIQAPSIDMVSIEGSGEVTGEVAFTAGAVRLSVSGSGDMTLQLDCDAVEAEVSGSGDIRLAGRCSTLKCGIAGSGDIDAARLACRDAALSVSGSGSIGADASGRVDASISGSGGIALARKPASLSKRITGSGSLRVRP